MRIWIGDSRTVGMQIYYPESDTDAYIAEGGEGISWFNNTAVPALKLMLATGPHQVIILMGVNDCAGDSISNTSSAESYINTVNALVEEFPTSPIYFCAVNPVDGNYQGVQLIYESELTRKICVFNNKIKSLCTATFIDTYTHLTTTGFSTIDGIHYDKSTTTKIRDYVIDFILNGVPTASVTLDALSYFLHAAKTNRTDQAEETESSSSWLANLFSGIGSYLQDYNTVFTNGFLDSIKDESLKFVLECAGSVTGLVTRVFPQATCRNSLVEDALDAKMGSWINGPSNGHTRTPHPGDIIFIRTEVFTGRYKPYDCNHIGIVTNVLPDQKFEYTYGTRDGVERVELPFDDNKIAGYYRAKWSIVGANIYNQLGIGLSIVVYNELSGKDDAAIREVGFLNGDLEPSIWPSNLRWSVINYTSGISALFLAWGGSIGSGLNIVFDNLVLEGFSEVQCAILSQLMSYGLNAAISIGILANIYHESNFDPAAKGDYENGVPTSFGLCQWHYERGSNMKAHCGGGDLWKTNVTGQVDFLWKELQGSYLWAYNLFKDSANTLEGCQHTARQFCINFEVPADRYNTAVTRASTATKYWNAAVMQLGVTS